jgi:hypothetical protein
MATITLEYNARNVAIKKALELLFTLGAKERTYKTAYEQAMDDIKKGKISYINGPKDKP